MSGFVSDNGIESAVSKAASYLGLSYEEALTIMRPYSARDQDENDKRARAAIANYIYGLGYSLSEVGYIMGDLSKERVRQILVTFGYETRPMPGSARWRLERARV